MTNRRSRQYRICNWREYNSALVSRGSLTLCVEQRSVNKWRDPSRPRRRGRRPVYSDLAIQCALTLREVYYLPLRSTQGLVRSVLRLLQAEDDAIRRSREVGKEEWKKESGSHRRSLTENAVMRIKSLFSDRLKSRQRRRQEMELRLRCAALNRMTAPGMPKSRAV